VKLAGGAPKGKKERVRENIKGKKAS
jgi:hypothetical protein